IKKESGCVELLLDWRCTASNSLKGLLLPVVCLAILGFISSHSLTKYPPYTHYFPFFHLCYRFSSFSPFSLIWANTISAVLEPSVY
ncbi:hypothetical protein BDQ17DRAFT_1357036, partial [Cyathus striatus]